MFRTKLVCPFCGAINTVMIPILAELKKDGGVLECAKCDNSADPTKWKHYLPGKEEGE